MRGLTLFAALALTTVAFAAVPTASALCVGAECVTVDDGNVCYRSGDPNGQYLKYCVGLDGLQQCYKNADGERCDDIL